MTKTEAWIIIAATPFVIILTIFLDTVFESVWWIKKMQEFGLSITVIMFMASCLAIIWKWKT